MPFLAIINPQVPEGHENEFLAALNKIAPEMKAQPGVLGVSAGPIVTEDGAPVTGFKYLETIGTLPHHITPPYPFLELN